MWEEQQGQQFSRRGHGCLKIDMCEYVLVFMTTLNKAKRNTKTHENADKPQTINQSSHWCRLVELLENGWVGFFRVRTRGLCHYNASSRPLGWHRKSLTGVKFKLIPRQRVRHSGPQCGNFLMLHANKGGGGASSLEICLNDWS